MVGQRLVPRAPDARFVRANVRRNLGSELKARRGCIFCEYWACHPEDYNGVCSQLHASTGPRCVCDEFAAKKNRDRQ